MPTFWTIIFFSSSALCGIFLLSLIYQKLRRKSGDKAFYCAIAALFLLFFSQSKISDCIVEELVSDIKSNRLILDNNKFLTKSKLLTLRFAAQKHNFSEEKIVVLVLPANDTLTLKKDYINNKYWLFYSKYFYSKDRSIGYIE